VAYIGPVLSSIILKTRPAAADCRSPGGRFDPWTMKASLDPGEVA